MKTPTLSFITASVLQRYVTNVINVLPAQGLNFPPDICNSGKV